MNETYPQSHFNVSLGVRLSFKHALRSSGLCLNVSNLSDALQGTECFWEDLLETRLLKCSCWWPPIKTFSTTSQRNPGRRTSRRKSASFVEMLRRAKAWDENHTSLDAIRITVQPLPSSFHYVGHFGLVTTRNCVQVALHQLCQLCQSDNDLDKSNSIWSLDRVFKGLKKLKSSKCAHWNSILETVKMKEPDAWSHLDQDLASKSSKGGKRWKKAPKVWAHLVRSSVSSCPVSWCAQEMTAFLWSLPSLLSLLLCFILRAEHLEGSWREQFIVTWCNLM